MMRYIISLSTIPPRFPYLLPTLKRLLNQSVKAEHIIVFIPHSYRRFPDWDGVLPEVPDGVEIRRCEKDYGPATKILPALKQFAGQDIDILFCDDDMKYRRTWAAGFLRQRKKQPEACLALCAHEAMTSPWEERTDKSFARAYRNWRITDVENYIREGIQWFKINVLNYPTIFLGRRVYLSGGHEDIFDGFAGVMVRPHFFDEDTFDIPEIMWSVDDYWLSGQAMKNGHPVWVLPRQMEPSSFPVYKTDALHEAVLDGVNREAANLHTLQYFQEKFGVWK